MTPGAPESHLTFIPSLLCPVLVTFLSALRSCCHRSYVTTPARQASAKASLSPVLSQCLCLYRACPSQKTLPSTFTDAPHSRPTQRGDREACGEHSAGPAPPTSPEDSLQHMTHSQRAQALGVLSGGFHQWTSGKPAPSRRKHTDCTPGAPTYARRAWGSTILTSHPLSRYGSSE